MKRIGIILVLLLTVLLLHAQQGLHVNELFEGRIVPQERMMVTKVRGKMIAKYQLSFFHSLRFYAAPDQVSHIMTLIEKDRTGAGVQDYSIAQAGHTESHMIRLAPKGKMNRYLCVKTERKTKKTNEVVVIYMEGTLSSLEKLKEILK